MIPANVSSNISFYQNPLATTDVLSTISDYADKCRVRAWMNTLKQYKICNTSSALDHENSYFREILSTAEDRTLTCSILAWKNAFRQYNITKEDFIELLKSENDISEEEEDSLNRDIMKESVEKKLGEVAHLYSSDDKSWSKATIIGLLFLGATGGVGLLFCVCYATKFLKRNRR
jgi:hypothetical protein